MLIRLFPSWNGYPERQFEVFSAADSVVGKTASARGS